MYLRRAAKKLTILVMPVSLVLPTFGARARRGYRSGRVVGIIAAVMHAESPNDDAQMGEI